MSYDTHAVSVRIGFKVPYRLYTPPKPSDWRVHLLERVPRERVHSCVLGIKGKGWSYACALDRRHSALWLIILISWYLRDSCIGNLILPTIPVSISYFSFRYSFILFYVVYLINANS